MSQPGHGCNPCCGDSGGAGIGLSEFREPPPHMHNAYFMLELGRVVNLLVGFTAGVDFMLWARSNAHFMLWSRSIACFKLWSKPLAFFSVSLSFLKARLLCLSSF